jgi:hypothetical protein
MGEASLCSMSQVGSHSADIEMWLDCGERGRVELTRISPKSVVAQTPPRNIAPQVAELVISIDGKRLRSRVHLRSGFRNGRRAALITPVSDDIAPS